MARTWRGAEDADKARGRPDAGTTVGRYQMLIWQRPSWLEARGPGLVASRLEGGWDRERGRAASAVLGGAGRQQAHPKKGSQAPWRPQPRALVEADLTPQP